MIQRFSSLNKGIDIGGTYRSIIKAAASGKVVYANKGIRGYGYLIIIKHNAEYLTAYGHNNQLLIRTGQWIKSGQPIARMGKTPTGRVMLHFEVRYKGKPVDPAAFL
jgi:lipoprotein NlpD